jgi:hypothetical protein
MELKAAAALEAIVLAEAAAAAAMAIQAGQPRRYLL